MPVQGVKTARGRKEAGNHQHVDGGSAAEKRVRGAMPNQCYTLQRFSFPKKSGILPRTLPLSSS
jgi:hypothetical protein